jgi:hypothetical protein
MLGDEGPRASPAGRNTNTRRGGPFGSLVGCSRSRVCVACSLGAPLGALRLLASRGCCHQPRAGLPRYSRSVARREIALAATFDCKRPRRGGFFRDRRRSSLLPACPSVSIARCCASRLPHSDPSNSRQTLFSLLRRRTPRLVSAVWAEPLSAFSPAITFAIPPWVTRQRHIGLARSTASDLSIRRTGSVLDTGAEHRPTFPSKSRSPHRALLPVRRAPATLRLASINTRSLAR